MAERQVVPLQRAIEHGLGVDLYPAQRDLVADLEATPNGVIAAGRRGGKTRTAAAVALADLLYRPDLDALVQKGETRYSVVFATNREQARRLIEAARLIVDGSRAARRALTAQTADELAFVLPDGARVALRAFPCSSRGGRGYPVSTLILDEAAHFITTEDGDATAQRIFEAMRPSSAQFGRLARCLLVSSPMGDTGFYVDMWRRANDGALPGWGAYQITSKQMNPSLSDEFLALLEQESPETFASEYEAAFESGGSGFFDLEQVQIDPALGEAEPAEASGWIAGLDPAYSGVDGFGVALVGSRGSRLVLGPVRAIVPARSRGKSWEVKRGAQDAVTAEVCKLVGRYTATAYTDQHESGAVVARAAELGLKAMVYGMTRERKHEAFLELRGRLYTGGLVLPNNADLLDELRRVKLKLGQGGPQIILPRSSRGHCDQVQALALAVVKHAGGGQGQILVAKGRIPGVGPRGWGRGSGLTPGGNLMPGPGRFGTGF